MMVQDRTAGQLRQLGFTGIKTDNIRVYFMIHRHNKALPNPKFGYSGSTATVLMFLAKPPIALYNPHSLKKGIAATTAVQFNIVLSIIP